MASSSTLSGQAVENQVIALKKKTELAKKSELLREIHKLDVQIQAMEREKLTHIFSKRSDFCQDFKPLEEEEAKLNDERKTEKVKVRQQLGKVSYLVKRFQRELREAKPTPEFVEKLKSMMEEIEGTIHYFKEQQRGKYDEMLRSERTLMSELQQLERKFESWNPSSRTDQSSSQNTSALVSANYRDISRDLPSEVVAFDKFVHQTGGHYGGWDQQDHQIFLKYRNMHKGRIVFLDHVKPFLPIRTETEIREHESWFQEYTFLNESKKYAIKKWREKKEEEKEDAIYQAQGDLDTKQEETTKKQKLQDIMAEEKAEKSKQINAWRVQKELEKAMKEEQKLRVELQKKQQQEEERKQQLETKKRVEEFRQQKQIEEEFLSRIEEEKKQVESERRRQIIAKEIGRFRNRDIKRLTEKLEKEREKEEKKKENDKKIEALKFQVEAARDPNRLLQPTAGWKERLKDQGSSGGGQVFHMPHRAIPTWRQGMF